MMLLAVVVAVAVERRHSVRNERVENRVFK